MQDPQRLLRRLEFWTKELFAFRPFSKVEDYPRYLRACNARGAAIDACLKAGWSQEEILAECDRWY